MRGIMKYINRISRSSGIVYNAQLKHYGVNHCQHPYILLICSHPGISQEELARAICVHKSNVTRQLAALESAGYLTRRQSQEDKRVLQVYPTEKMQQLLPQVRSVMQTWNACILDGLTDEEREQLAALLEKAAQKATQAAQEILHGSGEGKG